MFGDFRKQTAVFWSSDSVSPDGYGDLSFGTGVEIKVRWKDENEVFIDETGTEQVSNAIVYPDRSIPVESYLYLGELSDLTVPQQSDPKTVDDAYIVKKSSDTKDLSNLENLVKVWL